MPLSDYGSDFSCVSDLGPNLEVVEGVLVVIQAVARRLETPRGGLFYDEEYGTDLRAYVNSNAGPLEIARAAELEAMKDERVLAADATVNRSGQSITVTMKLTLADGPFDLTLDVSDLTVDLITFNAAA